MKVVRQLLNDKGQIYWLKITTENPGRFVRELWESMSNIHTPRTDEDGCNEWTDRGREYRTSVSGKDVVIRTHAWHPRGDTKELHTDVMKFLKEKLPQVGTEAKCNN